MKTKIIFIIIAVVLFLGAGVGEFFILRKIDHSYQENESAQVFADIALDLNMIKAAIISQDADNYIQYSDNFREKMKILNDFSYIAQIYDERINMLERYASTIDENAILMDDLAALKSTAEDISQSISGKYGNVDDASDTGLGELRSDLNTIKESLPGVVTEAGESIKARLIKIIDKAIVAADDTNSCLNECYSERMTEITNGFKDELNLILEENTALNDKILQQFRLDDLDSLTLELTQ